MADTVVSCDWLINPTFTRTELRKVCVGALEPVRGQENVVPRDQAPRHLQFRPSVRAEGKLGGHTYDSGFRGFRSVRSLALYRAPASPHAVERGRCTPRLGV